MRCKVKPAFPGMIPANDYARKYGVTNPTVHYWVKTGKVNGMKDGMYLHVEDMLPPVKQGDSFRGDEKRCGFCRMWKPLTDYSKSRRERAGGLCRPCNAHQERVRTGKGASPDTISYKQEIAAQVEVVEAKKIRRLGERNARIEAHAKRIEARGMSGDGKDWLDGEGS
ncbi:MAG: hypothetical protein ACPGYS_07115 [Flavobacteriales bacterium]